MLQYTLYTLSFNFFVLLGAVVWLYREYLKILDELDARKRLDSYLDLVFRTFYIDVTEPYQPTPGFDEPRCIHCRFPQVEGHSPNCIWRKTECLRKKFYENA